MTLSGRACIFLSRLFSSHVPTNCDGLLFGSPSPAGARPPPLPLLGGKRVQSVTATQCEDQESSPGTKPHQVLRVRGGLCKSSPVKELPSLISLFHLSESPPLNLSFFSLCPQPRSSFYSPSRTANLVNGRMSPAKSPGSVAIGNGTAQREKSKMK